MKTREMAKDYQKGGRPPHQHLKLVLHDIMHHLRIADVHLVLQTYTQQTGRKANYHTIKKYLDILVKDDILRRELVSDNIRLLKAGKRKQRRRLYLYHFN